MIIGYARVSTDEQHLDLQVDALEKAGCDVIYQDQGISAVARHRPGFEQAMSALSNGDVFVVWKLDRAFRSVKHASNIIEDFIERKIQFRSLTDEIDTNTAHGKLHYHITNVFAEFERNLISERTKAGMIAAKKRGAQIGRPKKLSNEQIEWAKEQLQRSTPPTRTALAKALNVSPKTLKRALII